MGLNHEEDLMHTGKYYLVSLCCSLLSPHRFLEVHDTDKVAVLNYKSCTFHRHSAADDRLFFFIN